MTSYPYLCCLNFLKKVSPLMENPYVPNLEHQKVLSVTLKCLSPSGSVWEPLLAYVGFH
jgi:hypothetical protein